MFTEIGRAGRQGGGFGPNPAPTRVRQGASPAPRFTRFTNPVSSATIDHVSASRSPARCLPLGVALALGATLTGAACRETLDAGHNQPHGPLPVDERNPVILYNDAERDN